MEAKEKAGSFREIDRCRRARHDRHPRRARHAGRGRHPGGLRVLLPAFLALLLPAVTPSLGAAEEELVVDGSSAWEPILRRDNVILEPGFRGLPELRLGDRSYRVEGDTDLLMSFEPAAPGELTGNYRLLTTPRTVGRRPRVGRGAAGFAAGTDAATAPAATPLRLEPQPDALFFPGSAPGSFSIEFWLLPVAPSDGEGVLEWEGILGSISPGRTQSVRAVIRNRRLHWSLENLFQTPDASELTIELTGRDLLIPRRWQHHLIRYRGDIGLLEYLVDGRVQDAVHATSSGGEEGDVYTPIIGSRSPRRLIIGGSFNGLLDELRMSRRFVTDPILAPDTPDPGSVVLGPLDMGEGGSLLQELRADIHEPGLSEARLSFRVTSDNILRDGGWRPFPSVAAAGSSAPEAVLSGPGMLEEAVVGRYVWIRAELYPGEMGDPSPRLRRFTLRYTPNEPPPAPRGVRVEAGDGEVRLSWNEVLGDDVSGYRVYYGRSSGEYLGTTAAQGPSPIDVGDSTGVTIRGLRNGSLYYFAVAAYDEAVSNLLYSREVVARPTRMR